jgi:hypothetical protein
MRTQPFRPCVFVTRAMQMSSVFIGALLQYFEREPLFELHTCRAQDGPDRPRGSALFSDDFTKVALSNSQFKNRRLFTFYWPHGNLIRIVHESFRDLLDELLHSHRHIHILLCSTN